MPEVKIVPEHLEVSADAYRAAARGLQSAYQTPLNCPPEMPGDLEAKARALAAQARRDLGQQHRFVLAEAKNLDLVASKTRKADAKGTDPDLANLYRYMLEIHSGPGINSRYRPPAPKKKGGGFKVLGVVEVAGVIKVVADISGLTDAYKAFKDLKGGNFKGFAKHLAMAAPTPGGKLAKIGKIAEASLKNGGRATVKVTPKAGAHTAGKVTPKTPKPGGGVVKYDADAQLGRLAGGKTAKASELKDFAKSQGWVQSQTATGPLKFADANGVVRLTIKTGSGRTPGSNLPHVEIRNAAGKRVDPYGNEVTRKSAGNHTPIDWDLP